MEKFTEIANGVYHIHGSRSNIFLLADSDLTLIDTGMPGDDKIILNTIKEIGRNPHEIKHILVTHAHMDHIGSVSSMKKETGAKIVASKEEIDYIEGRKKMWTMGRTGFGGKIFKTIMFVMETFVWKYGSAKVDIPCDDGEKTNSFGGIEAIATPGHSHGSLSFYIKERGMLFTGDALSSIPTLRTPLKAGCSDHEKALISVKKISGLSFGMLFPGHGAPITSDADKMVRELM